MNTPSPLAVAVTPAPAPAPAPGPAPGPAPAPAPDASPAATTAAPADLHLPGASLGSLALPGLVLAALAVAALLLGRRRRPAARLVQVLETQSLGPRRALVVARLGDEVLVLGSSEAGIALLATRPAGAAAPAVAGQATPLAGLRAPEAEPPAPLQGLVARLRLARGGKAAPGFDALLAESAEDQELRRKLSRGQAGSVR